MTPQVGTCTKLVLRIERGPKEIRCQGETICLGSNDAACACLVLVTTLAERIISEQIIAVTVDVFAFILLAAYAREGGGITLET